MIENRRYFRVIKTEYKAIITKSFFFLREIKLNKIYSTK